MDPFRAGFGAFGTDGFVSCGCGAFGTDESVPYGGAFWDGWIRFVRGGAFGTDGSVSCGGGVFRNG